MTNTKQNKKNMNAIKRYFDNLMCSEIDLTFFVCLFALYRKMIWKEKNICKLKNIYIYIVLSPFDEITFGKYSELLKHKRSINRTIF